MTPIQVVCESCGQPFVCWRLRRFCSRSCSVEHRSVPHESDHDVKDAQKKSTGGVGCVVCGKKFGGKRGEVCSDACRRKLVEGDDPVEVLIKWVKFLVGDVSGDEWLVVSTLHRENRPLKAFEVACIARWSDAKRPLMDKAIMRLVDVGVLARLDVDDVVKYTLNTPIAVPECK